MKTSLNGKIALVVSEGLVDTPYLDSVGVWTVGVGITKAAGWIDPAAHKGKTFTVKELFDAFELVLKKYEAAVNRLVKVPLKQHEFDALVHFVYNIGEGGFARSKLLSNLNAGRKSVAFDSGFHGWLKPPELRGRRDKERRMALYGEYGGDVAPLYGVNSNFKPRTKGTVNVRSHLGSGSSVQPVSPTPAPDVPSDTQSSSTGLLGAFLGILKALGKALFGRNSR